MAIDTSTPEGRRRELRNIALLQAKKKLCEALAEIEYLIMATPTSERRNTLTEVNIHVMHGNELLLKLTSEES